MKSRPDLDPRSDRLDLLTEANLLQLVTETARVGLAVIGADRTFLFANASFGEILGLPSSDVVGRALSEVMADVYEEQVRPHLDRAFQGERVQSELLKATPSGTRRYSIRREPTVVGGRVTSVVVVITDTTELRRAELDAMHSRAIVEWSDDAIISKDLNGIITTWNAGAKSIFGYSSDEMIGRPIARLIPPELQEEERRILETIRRGERVHHFETSRLTKSGQLIAVSVTVSPIKDAAGTIIGASKVARDISERKRADDELRLQQAMLLTERELTLDGILVVDASENVLSFNKRFTRMCGLSNYAAFTPGDAVSLRTMVAKVTDQDRYRTRVREIYARRGESSRDEIALIDGRIFDRYSAPMQDADGRYYGRVWYFRDITEHRLAETALRRERDRAQRYLDTADVVLLALDTEGRVTSINRKGCELLARSEGEVLGRGWIDTCVPDRYRDELRMKFQRLISGDLSVVENPIVASTGEERLLEWRNSVLRDESGRVVGTFSSGTDVTEQRSAVEALRIAEERMRFALTNAGVGIWDVDYATGIVRMSEILEAQLGIVPGEFTGTFEAFIETVHPEDRPGLVATMESAARTGGEFSSQHRTAWTDGTVRWLTSAGRFHLDQGGQPARGIGISMDVSARRNLEQQYHHAQKMEAVGRLAGGVAHDFNNLLTAILGYCQLLLYDLAPNDPRRTDILEIQQAGQSAAGLTRQLLAFSRKQIVEPTVLDVNELIRNMQGLLQRLIEEDVKVVLNLRHGLGGVKADRGQMEQVIMNLAVNARDAMPDGGTLTIETANVELDADYASRHFSVTPGPYVSIVMSDTGTGMTSDVQARLFEPFFTTKELGKGTGLGLATVHGIVTANGGSVGVYSEIGKGSSFAVYLPRVTNGEPVEAAPSPRGRTHTGGEVVLVVEDADGLRELATRMLERRGFVVLGAANTDEAIEQFERNASIDVVLTDVVMPGGSGPLLVARLLAIRPALKVVYMSGYTEDAISHHGVLDPGVALLHKPFTAETLEHKLREVLDR